MYMHICIFSGKRIEYQVRLSIKRQHKISWINLILQEGKYKFKEKIMWSFLLLKKACSFFLRMMLKHQIIMVFRFSVYTWFVF